MWVHGQVLPTCVDTYAVSGCTIDYGTEFTSRHRSEETRSMAGTDKRKQSLYFPESMLQDIQKEAA